MNLIARLKPGVDLVQAQAELSTLEAQLAVEHPDAGHGRTAFLHPARTFGPEIASTITAFSALMLSLVGLVLIIGCINVAGLLLARSAARQPEISIRRALGASRGRLVRQLLSEACLLSTIGCAAASLLVLIAIRGVPSVVSVSPTSPLAALALEFSIDGRVLAFTIGLTLATAMLCGLVPAWQASKDRPLVALEGRSITLGRRRSRLRATLMIGQVATATLLLVLAGLATRGLLGASSLDLGLRGEHVFTTSIDLSALGYDAERRLLLYEQLLQRVEQIPGVGAANVATILPITMTSRPVSLMRDGDAPPDPRRGPPPVMADAVSRGHFLALGIPLLAGRDFTQRDTADALPRVHCVILDPNPSRGRNQRTFRR